MKSGWQTVRFADVCELRKGKKPRLFDSSVADSKPYLVAKLLRGKAEPKFALSSDKNSVPVSAHELIIICDGSNSGETFIGFDGILSSTMAKIAHGDKLEPRFLRYFLDSKFEKFGATKTGAAIPHLDLAGLREVALPLPPLAEQRRIVAILDQAIEAIDAAEGNTERSVLNAQELLASYLNSAFDDNGTGEKSIALGSCVEFRNGLNFTKSSKGQTVKIVGVGDFRDEFWAPLNELQSVTLDGRLNDGDRLRDGDLLVVRSNGNVELIGRTVVAKGVGDEVISHSGFTIRIRQTESRFDPAYLCYFLKSGGTRRKLVEGGTGTNIKSLNQGMLAGIQVPCPALARQRDIVDKLDQVSGESRRLREIYQERMVATDALRQSTLNAAFTGKL
jgi:type I restriction enzyme S subunit